MRREAKCQCCRADMKFDEGHYLEVIIVQQPSALDMLGGPPTQEETKERANEFEGDTERFVPPMFQQPVARLLCDQCMQFIQIDDDMREQSRLRAMAWWRDMLPREAVRLEARPCGSCGGKGDMGRLPCQVCSRSGTIIIRSPAKKCATCNGTGKGFLSMHFGVGGTCSFCHGLGWQFDPRGAVRQSEAAAKKKRRSDGKKEMERFGKRKTFAEVLGIPPEEEEAAGEKPRPTPPTEQERRREFPF